MCQMVKRDSTGGMTRKISEANKMAKVGFNGFVVNGNKPKRISDAILGKQLEGTLFRK